LHLTAIIGCAGKQTMPGNSTILVADDDQNDIFFLKRAFQKAGLPHSIVEVSDGQSAVDYLSGKAPFANRAQHPLPDLLLLDLKMPRMTGFEVLAWLQTQPQLDQMPVVVLSGSNQPRDIEHVQRLGASDYKVKPVEFDELLNLVRHLDERWLRTTSRSS
jgi:CheY-like chemotaxis protein